MEAGLPEEDSELSREGQLLHDYSAHVEYDRRVLKPNQQDLLALGDALIKQVIERVESEADLTGKAVKDFTETTLQMRYMSLSGTPDWLRYYAAEPFPVALVLDRKFGYNVVERAELNLQLRAYAVLASDFTSNRLDHVFAAIVQPRTTYDERITIAKYTPEDIEDSSRQIAEILEASKKEDAPLVPGDEQCRYCKAKLVCPAFKDKMMVPAVLTPDQALSKAAREAYLEAKLAECSDDQLEQVYLAERLGNMIHDPLGDEIRKRKAAGGMENFEIAKDSEVREVVNVRRAMALMSLAGFEKTDLYECVRKFSLTSAEEILRKKHPNWTAKQAADWCNFKLSSVIERQTRKGRIIRK